MPFRPGERSLLLDPGGTPPLRTPGINLLLYPESQLTPTQESLVTSELSAFGQLITGTSGDRISFETEFQLPQSEWDQLKALKNWLHGTGGNYEVILYYLWEPYSELGEGRSRAKVPDTTVSTVPLGQVTQYTYYPVLQGIFDCQGELIGYQDEAVYRVAFSWYEGTIIAPGSLDL